MRQLSAIVSFFRQNIEPHKEGICRAVEEIESCIPGNEPHVCRSVCGAAAGLGNGKVAVRGE